MKTKNVSDLVILSLTFQTKLILHESNKKSLLNKNHKKGGSFVASETQQTTEVCDYCQACCQKRTQWQNSITDIL